MFSSVPSSTAAIARSRVVTGNLRLRSTFANRMSRLLVSSSTHAPRYGMSLTLHKRLPVAGSSPKE